MLDLQQHLLRQMAFSHATFGPGNRRKGVIDHIRKELDEIEAGDGDPDEWVDVVILALDGLTRQLAFGDGIERENPTGVALVATMRILAKQAKNEGRIWPDYRTASADKAIEHDRSTD